MSDMIKAYGLDINYYKLKPLYPEIFKPILDANHLSIHAYGEEFAQEWEDPVKMIAYIHFEQDGIILNSYGIQPDSNITMYLNQTDFAIAMARKLSRWQEYKVVGDSEFILDFGEIGGGNDTGSNDLIKNRDNITIDFRTDLFDGTLQAILTDNTLNQILMHDSCSVDEQNCNLKETPIIVPCKVVSHGNLKIDTGRINPMLYKGDHYNPFEDELVDAHLHLEIVSIIKDKHGCIRIMGGIRGGVIYHDTTVIGKYLDKVGPEVGDLIDIPVTSDTNIYRQKYEIVNIQQNRANESFMNPFLRNYIYEINLRAYVSSGQVEPNGPTIAQVELQDKLDLINTATEDAAKKISLYEDFEDDVYGGYDKINFRGKPSVQRDASKSTINNFEPPKKTKGLRKTTKNLFIFKDMGMVLSLVDDPKNNNSFLKLSPRKKSTKIDSETNYLDYLRADDDTLVLVNGIQAYLLMSRFKRMELDDDTYCLKPIGVKPIRLKHEVYAQHNGWADQPFHLVDGQDEIAFDEETSTPYFELNMNLQDLKGDNSTPTYKPVSENRLTFPYTNTYLYVSYDKVEEDVDNPFEIWTCNVVLNGDETKTPFPICSFIKNN